MQESRWQTPWLKSCRILAIVSRVAVNYCPTLLIPYLRIQTRSGRQPLQWHTYVSLSLRIIEVFWKWPRRGSRFVQDANSSGGRRTNTNPQDAVQRRGTSSPSRYPRSEDSDQSVESWSHLWLLNVFNEKTWGVLSLLYTTADKTWLLQCPLISVPVEGWWLD